MVAPTVLVAPWSGQGNRLAGHLGVFLAERLRDRIAAAGLPILGGEAVEEALSGGGWGEGPDPEVLAAAAARVGAGVIVRGRVVWSERIEIAIRLWPGEVVGEAEGPPAGIWGLLERAAAPILAALSACPAAPDPGVRPPWEAVEALLGARAARGRGGVLGVRRAVAACLDLAPAWEEPLEVLAEALSSAKEWSEAGRIHADLADRARSRGEADRAAASLFDSARCRRAAGDLEGTVELLARSAAEARDPALAVRARLLRSEFLRQMERGEEAVSEARLALAAASGRAREEAAARFSLATSLAGTDLPAAAGEFGLALEGFAAAGDPDGVARVARSLGVLFEDPAARERAGESVRRVAEALEPGGEPWLLALLRAYLAARASRAGDPGLAGAIADWLAELERIGDPEILSEAWERAARWLEEAGEEGTARRYRGERETRSPGAPLLDELRSAEAVGRHEEVVRIACRGLAADPGSTPLLLARARAYRELGRGPLAAFDLERAVAADPADPAVRLERARTVASDPEMFDCDACEGAIEDLSLAAADPALAAEACALAGAIRWRHFGDAVGASEWLSRSRASGTHAAAGELERMLAAGGSTMPPWRSTGGS